MLLYSHFPTRELKTITTIFCSGSGCIMHRDKCRQCKAYITPYTYVSKQDRWAARPLAENQIADTNANWEGLWSPSTIMVVKRLCFSLFVLLCFPFTSLSWTLSTENIKISNANCCGVGPHFISWRDKLHGNPATAVMKSAAGGRTKK